MAAPETLQQLDEGLRALISSEEGWERKHGGLTGARVGAAFFIALNVAADHKMDLSHVACQVNTGFV